MNYSTPRLKGLKEVRHPARSRCSFIPIDRLESHEGSFPALVVDDTEIHENTARRIMKDSLAVALSELTPRQQKVIKLRYGLDGKIPRTYDELGRMFGVTRERIHQIERDALSKLRELSASMRLGGLIGIIYMKI